MAKRHAPSSKDAKPPPLPSDWTRCHAYMSSKGRFCRQMPVHSNFCGNHQHLLSTAATNRIPCPLDPSHYIEESNVDKHLQICPKAKKLKLQSEKYFYKHNLNAGGHGPVAGCRGGRGGGLVAEEQSPSTWAQKLALRVIQLHHQVFLNHHQQQTMDPVMVSYDDILNALALVDLSADHLGPLDDACRHFHIKAGGKQHLHQQASLIGHVLKLSLDDDNVKQTIEVGAGRGMLGLQVAGVLRSERLVMIERGGVRSKADTVLRKCHDFAANSYMGLQDIKNWCRVQCDLAHVDMKTLVRNEDGQALVIAKHLCGAGTDLALKSLEPIREQVSALVFATCCHGVCAWNDYVGRETWAEWNLGETEFETMSRWSAGTVQQLHEQSQPLGEGRDDNEHNAACCKASSSTGTCDSVTSVAKSLGLKCGVNGLGRACQRLIDYGRQQYIRQMLGHVDCQLLYYVPESATPQNAVLIATNRKASECKD